MQPLYAVLKLAVYFHNGGRIAVGDRRKINRRSPFDRIHDDLLDLRLIIDWERLMTRAEVEHLTLAAVPAAAAAEHLAALEPADEYLLVRLRDIEVFAVHLPRAGS